MIFSGAYLFESLLCAWFEAKESDRNRELLIITEVHENWNHMTIVSGYAAVVAEEYVWITGKRRQANFVIKKRAPTVDAPRQREFRQGAFGITSIVKDYVH